MSGHTGGGFQLQDTFTNEWNYPGGEQLPELEILDPQPYWNLKFFVFPVSDVSHDPLAG